ncbi:fungal-specific transcription factor domain-containing protein [Aspergillus varians]
MHATEGQMRWRPSLYELSVLSDSRVLRLSTTVQTSNYDALEKATETIRRQAGVLQLLFPGSTLDDLVEKDRPELIQLLSQASSLADASLEVGPPDIVSSPALSGSGQLGDAHDGPESDRGDSEEDRHWDELAPNPATIATSDDINAIGLAGDRHRRSYLGICSVSAVLRALFRFCPGAKDRIVEASRLWPGVQQEDNRPSLLFPQGLAIAPAPDALREMRYIGFYFEHIHAITPFLHEESFRATFAARDRQSLAWLGLCNMVLTVGSIASGSDSAHIHYYKQARSCLDLDSLGSGNLETLQALCLLGGYYLHYRNSPNMAYAILGAAQRLAIALGLHRESPVRTEHQDPEMAPRYAIRIETRRRTWWSLYCLDTWASMTLGRPTCGRWDSSTMNTLLPTALHPDDHFATSLRASAEFCHIGNRLQHRFAQSTRISINVAQALDHDLQEWYSSLDPVLKDTMNAPPRMAVAREFLRNRYYNVRLTLSRCFLLYMAYDEPKKHHRRPRQAEEERMAHLCRSIAAEAIDTIALHWVPNRTQVWNSAWYLFQACMVPLLSIAMAAVSSNSGASIDLDNNNIMSWYSSLNKALEIFTEMKPWMRASDRAPNIVEVLVQAVSQGAEGSIHTPSVADGGLHLFGLPDELLTEMDWSLFPNDENMFQCLFPLT